MGYQSVRTTLKGLFASGDESVLHKLRVGLIGFERLRTRRESGLGSTLIDLAGESCARQREGGDNQSGGNERFLEHSISSVLEALSRASNCSFGAGGRSVTGTRVCDYYLTQVVMRLDLYRAAKLARGVSFPRLSQIAPTRFALAVEAECEAPLSQGATMAARARPRRYIMFGFNPPFLSIQARTAAG